MQYCPKCREKLIVEDFCVECGADLSEYISVDGDNNIGNYSHHGGKSDTILRSESTLNSDIEKQFAKQEELDIIKLEKLKASCLEKEKQLEEQKRLAKQNKPEKPRQSKKENEKLVAEDDNEIIIIGEGKYTGL